MQNTQLELGLVPPSRTFATIATHRRRGRAAWWFNQMRRVVDSAMDWSEEVAARPEQITLPGTHREIQLSPR